MVVWGGGVEFVCGGFGEGWGGGGGEGWQENVAACNSRPTPRSKTGRPSLDAKFSSIIQQLQRNNCSGASALSRKNAPLGVLDLQLQSQEKPPRTEATVPFYGTAPVPAPRSKLRKSFRERISLKPL
uniref:Uncharacterized protein n=1 Tax=Knipowitschia caucasica TaxID=637954 RepID=A0AAV2JR98_KNICA